MATKRVSLTAQDGAQCFIRRAFYDDRHDLYYTIWRCGGRPVVVAPILSVHGELGIGTTAWTGLQGQVLLGVPQPEAWRDRAPGPCLAKVSFHDRNSLQPYWTQWELDLWPMPQVQSAAAASPAQLRNAA